MMQHQLGSTATPWTVWPFPPLGQKADTFIVDAEVALGEADVVVLVLGAPGARQRRLVLVDRRIQALQAPAQFLLPWEATMSHMYSMYLEGRRQAGSRVLCTQPTGIIYVLHVQPTHYVTFVILLVLLTT